MDEQSKDHEAKKVVVDYKCEKCGLQCRKPGEVFDHNVRSLHVVHYPDRSPDNFNPDNLLALCGKCVMTYHTASDKADLARRQTRDSLAANVIGRDHLLTLLYARLQRKMTFRLDGLSGIGKTTLFLWAYNNYGSERRAYVSCCFRNTEIIREIAKGLDIEGYEKKSTAKLEKEIIQSDKPFALFIDNIEEIKPQLITFLKGLHGKTEVRIYYAGKNGIVKENLKPLVWGVKCVRVPPITEKNSLKIAQKAIHETGAVVDINEVIKNSRGNPGRIWAACRGEPLNDDEHVKGEEMNIMPLIVVSCIALFIALRYTGKAAGSTDLYLLGGFGMAAAIFSRIFMNK